MLRLAGYVLGVFALIWVLRFVPGLRWLFGIPILNFFLAATILSTSIMLGKKMGAIFRA